MNRIYAFTCLYATLVWYAMLSSQHLQAQTQNPFFIESIDKTNTFAEDSIAISGRGFPTNTDDLRVTFGAAVVDGSQIQFASEFLIVAPVPTGATFNNIVVTDTSTKLSTSSSSFFTLSFGGSTFRPGKMGDNIPLAHEPSFPNPQPAYDLCVCDFNEDGKVDVALSQFDSGDPNSSLMATMIPIFLNTTTVAGTLTPTFDVSRRVSVGSPTIHITCGDLNGDGKPDLVATEAKRGPTNGIFLFILQNQYDSSNPTMPIFRTPATAHELPRNDFGKFRQIRRVALKDLDGDGHTDIIVNNETDSTLFVYMNEGTGDIATAFPSGDMNYQPVELVATGSRGGLQGLDVKDVNGDGLPEIITAKRNGDKVFVFHNRSRRGNLNMSLLEVFSGNPNSVSITNLVVGDVASAAVDGLLPENSTPDGKNDIVFTDVVRHKTHVLANTSEIGEPPSFTERSRNVGVGDGLQPWGLDMGDMDGDDTLDVVVTNIQDGGLYVLSESMGESFFESQSLSPEPVSRAPRAPARNVRVVDVNLDGKPDILTVSNAEGYTGSNLLYVSVNQHCLIPVIRPDESGGVRVCQGSSFFASTIPSPGTNYRWEIAPMATPDAFNCFQGDEPGCTQMMNSHRFDLSSITPDGTYVVHVLASSSGCLVSSPNTLSVINMGTAPPRPTITGATNGVLTVCGNAQTEIIPSTPNNASAHRWRGPNDFEASSETILFGSGSDSHTDVPGTYSYYYVDNSSMCPSDPVVVRVQTRNLPLLTPRFDGEAYACANTQRNPTLFSKDLEVEDFSGAGITIQWRYNGGTIGGETGRTHTATNPGEYRVLAGDRVLGCMREGPPVTLTAIVSPTRTRGTSDPPAIERVEELQREEIICRAANDQDMTGFAAVAAAHPSAEMVGLSTLSYRWRITADDSSLDPYPIDFSPPSPSQEELQHAFTRLGTFTVELWVGYEGLDCGIGSATVFPDDAEEYTVTEYVEGDADNAITREPNIGTVGTEKCPEQEVTLSAPAMLKTVTGNRIAGDTYRWSTGAEGEITGLNTNSNIRVKEAGTYRVHIIDQAGCELDTSAVVVNKDNSGILLRRDSDRSKTLDIGTVNEGEQIQLQIEGTERSGIIGWRRPINSGHPSGALDSPINKGFITSLAGLDTVDAINPILTANYDDRISVPPYVYEVVARDESNCASVASLSFTITPDMQPIGYPLFSPDGDGINDDWNIYKLSLYEHGKCNIRVFDRRGALLVKEDGVRSDWEGWDGTLPNGGDAATGVYYYVVVCECDEGDCPRENSGSILLTRSTR